MRRGNRVKAMVLYNMYSSHGWLDMLGPDIRDQVDVVFGDVRDPASVRELVEGATVVYHLAALGSVPYSYSAPRSFVDTNVIGTLHVLEAVRACQTPRLVHTSTSETYGTARTVPISEAHQPQAQSPYAASKIAADALAESYYLSFGTPVATLRPFNTFGPRQSARAVIPAIIIQLAAGSRQLKLGALDPTRDFSYVTNTAQAFVDLVRRRHQRSSARCSTSARERTSPSGGWPMHRQLHGRGRRHRRRLPAAAPQGLRGDAAGVRTCPGCASAPVATALHPR